MRRIPIQLDEETYRLLKRRAFQEGKSLAAIVRESLARELSDRTPWSVKDLPFVGLGRSKRDAIERVSENHDQALADAFLTRKPQRK